MAIRQALNYNSQPFSIYKNLHTSSMYLNHNPHIACLVSRNLTHQQTATQLSSNPTLTQDLEPGTTEEPRDSHQAAGGSKRPKVESGTTAAELEAEIAAKREQRAEWVRATKLTFRAQPSHGVGVTVVWAGLPFIVIG